MGGKTQTPSQGIINESLENQLIDDVEFDQWVKAVKQQMVAALRKRGNC